MNTKVILFSHHKVDELTIDRFNLVKRLNPTWDVVSVGFNGYDLLPNSLFVNREIYPKNKELVEVDNLHNEDWSNPDFFLYSGYSEFSNGAFIIIPGSLSTGRLFNILKEYRKRKRVGKLFCGGIVNYSFVEIRIKVTSMAKVDLYQL